MDLPTIVASAVLGALAGGASSFLLDLWRGRRDAHLRRLLDTRQRVMSLQHWLLDLYARGLQGRSRASKEQDHHAYADLEWIGNQQALDGFAELFYTVIREMHQPHTVALRESHWFADALEPVYTALDEQEALARQGRTPRKASMDEAWSKAEAAYEAKRLGR